MGVHNPKYTQQLIYGRPPHSSSTSTSTRVSVVVARSSTIVPRRVNLKAFTWHTPP